MAFDKPLRPLKQAIRRLLHPKAVRLLADDGFAEETLARLRVQIDGKSVALVGNAQALLSAGAGAAIDGHEFIMRFNAGYVSRPQHQGSRTDLVGVSSSMRPEHVAEGHHGAPVFFLSVNRDRMRSGYLRSIEALTIMPIGRFRALKDALGAKPSSGILALSVMRGFAPRSITLFGFDWKKTPTFYNTRIGVHDWAAEAALIQRWQAEDARLTIVDPAVPFNPAAIR